MTRDVLSRYFLLEWLPLEIGGEGNYFTLSMVRVGESRIASQILERFPNSYSRRG